MRKIPAICGILVFLIVLSAKGTVLFEDNFDSDSEWAAYLGEFETQVEDGRYTVENTGENIGFLKHSANYSTFTYTVSLQTLTENFQKVGVLFCWRDDAGGYELTINAQQRFTLGKYVKDENGFSYGFFELGFNSFINDGQNEISISKTGSTIQVACNGVKLVETTDESFTGGDIGLAVGEGQKVSFDHVQVTDQAQNFSSKEHFADNFDDGDMDGWATFNNSGIIENNGGALKMVSGDNDSSYSMIYTNGVYKNAPVKVIVKHEGGSDSAFYGISLVSINTTVSGNGYSVGYDAFNYRISPQRLWGAFSSRATQFSPQQSTHIRGTTDTLEITPDYRLVVNGDTLSDGEMGDEFEFNAVALYAPSNVSVSFDEFEAGEDIPSAIAYRPQIMDKVSKKQQFEVGGTGIVYDPRGREVARVTDNNYKSVLQTLGNGSFIIITKKNGKSFPIRRAVVVK